MTYEGKNWTKESEINYWRKKERDKVPLNDNIRLMFDDVFTQISECGINKTINRKNLKSKYNKYCKNGEK